MVPARALPQLPKTMKPVLVVDDDDSYRELVMLTLEEHCRLPQVQGFPGARPLLDHLRSRGGGPLGLVLLDLHMPEMSGLELIAHIRRIDPEVPVAILSGAGGAEDRAACLAAGAVAFLPKPAAYAELAGALRALVQSLDPAA